MPAIQNATQAVEKAKEMVRKYYGSVRLVRAVKEKDCWLVKFDVGILASQIVEVKLNAGDGEIMEFTAAGVP